MIVCFKVRALPINRNYRYLAQELRYVVENAELSAMVFERSYGALVRSSCANLPFLKSFLVIDDAAPTAPDVGRAPDWVPYEDAIQASRFDRIGLPARSADDETCSIPAALRACPKVWCGAMRTFSSVLLEGRADEVLR